MADATAATSRSRPRQIQTTSLFVTAQIARLYQGLPSELLSEFLTRTNGATVFKTSWHPAYCLLAF